MDRSGRGFSLLIYLRNVASEFCQKNLAFLELCRISDNCINTHNSLTVKAFKYFWVLSVKSLFPVTANRDPELWAFSIITKTSWSPT